MLCINSLLTFRKKCKTYFPPKLLNNCFDLFKTCFLMENHLYYSLISLLWCYVFLYGVTMGGIRQPEETTILDRLETNHSRSTAPRSLCAPPPVDAARGPGCPQEGQMLAWAAAHSDRSVLHPARRWSDLSILQAESPPKRQGPVWGGLSAVRHELGPCARYMSLEGVW